MTQNKIPTDEEILAKAKQRYTEEVPCFSWQEDHSRYVLQALGEARAAGREEQRERDANIADNITKIEAGLWVKCDPTRTGSAIAEAIRAQGEK